MMESIKPIEIPQSHIDFAKDLADLADKHGMDRLTATYRPHWDSPRITGCDTVGEVKIIYDATDGRGRPERKLSIAFQPMVSHTVDMAAQEPGKEEA